VVELEQDLLLQDRLVLVTLALVEVVGRLSLQVVVGCLSLQVVERQCLVVEQQLSYLVQEQWLFAQLE
jgi:hypothetical protein